MGATVFLAPYPRWNARDLIGQSLPNGKVYTYITGTTTPKATYSDALGENLNTNPVILDGDGGAYIFWLEDTLYRIILKDEDDNLIYDTSNYPQQATINNPSFISNLTKPNFIPNGQFLENLGASASPIGTTSLAIAPSGIPDINGGNILFVKSNTACTDTLTFTSFNLGSDLVPQTPIYYATYACTAVGGGGETFKAFRFCIAKNVRSLEGTTIVVSFSARSSTLSVITPSIFQYFGSGGSPSSTVTVLASATTLTTSFVRYDFVIDIPSVEGKTIGSCGDDYLGLDLSPPLNAICTLDITNVQVITGEVIFPYQYVTPNYVQAQLHQPKPGDVKTTYRTSEFGWVAMNDGSIGSATSGATTRANIDTFFLYKYLWENVSDTWCPVTTGRAGSAENDFNSNKAMFLPKVVGRALAIYGTATLAQFFTADAGTDQLLVNSTQSLYTGTPVTVSNSGGALPNPLVAATTYYVINIDSTHVKLATTLANAVAGTAIDITTAGTGTQTITVTFTARAMGEYLGESTHAQTVAELVSHFHEYNEPSNGGATYQAGGPEPLATSTPDNTAATGGSTAFNIMQPTTHMNVLIKL